MSTNRLTMIDVPTVISMYPRRDGRRVGLCHFMTMCRVLESGLGCRVSGAKGTVVVPVTTNEPFLRRRALS